MHKRLSLVALFAGALALSACVGSDLERGVGGAAVGAVGAKVIGGDPLVGAAVGGAAGVFCDDVTPGVCRRN